MDVSRPRDLPHGLYEGRGGGGGAADVTPSLQNTQVGIAFKPCIFKYLQKILEMSPFNSFLGHCVGFNVELVALNLIDGPFSLPYS